jgi:hypothetical protein
MVNDWWQLFSQFHWPLTDWEQCPLDLSTDKGAQTLSASACSVVPAALGLLLSRIPTVLSPFPLLTVLPAFFSAPAMAVIVPSILFSAWNPGLYRGEPKTPKRSYIFFAVLVVLSVIYFIAAWGDGLQFQGRTHTHAVCIVNIVWILVLASLFVLSRRRQSSFLFNLSLHWILFAWLAWYAFPYLGELP